MEGLAKGAPMHFFPKCAHETMTEDQLKRVIPDKDPAVVIEDYDGNRRSKVSPELCHKGLYLLSAPK
eukprot:1016341-Amphidinium_carterae.2